MRTDEIEAYRHGISLSESKLANWMIANSFTTGHGDTMEDLLRELSWQIEELRLQSATDRNHLNMKLGGQTFAKG
jgi:hypothetical protein